MAKQNVSGSGGGFEYGGAEFNFTKWTWKGTVKLADTTDSEDYNSASSLVWNSQIAASAKGEVSIEGKYDVNGNQDTLVQDLLDGATGPVACELLITPTEPFGFGNFNVQDFEVEVPVEDAVTFKCTLMTHGRFTLGAAP